MKHALNINGTWTEWDGRSFRDTNGILHQSNIASLWTEAERKAVGLYPIVETAIPEGKVSIGWTLVYDADTDTVTRTHTLADAPPPPVPQIVSRFQAKAALSGAGLLDQVEALMADPATPAVTKLAWAEAIEFHRDSATVVNMASALGLTEAQIDDLFRTAAGITA